MSGPVLRRAVYRSAPVAPDSEFETGELRHLVAGRAARLRDARRTPVLVTAIDHERGYFEVEVRDFEDAGARWLVPFEWADRYQFASGADASAGAVARMRSTVDVLSRRLIITADAAQRARTLLALDGERARAAGLVSGLELDLDALVRERTGSPAACAALAEHLGELMDIEGEFARTYVSNPGSGETVKGHAIVLAEMGLRSFEGTAVRDPALFEGRWSRERRRQHLLRRMGFVQALLGSTESPLYRGVSVEGPLPAPRPGSFVSATFSPDVARAHFDGRGPGATALLVRQPLPVERVLMTFVETAEMGRHFREAEALLIADPENRAF